MWGGIHAELEWGREDWDSNDGRPMPTSAGSAVTGLRNGFKASATLPSCHIRGHNMSQRQDKGCGDTWEQPPLSATLRACMRVPDMPQPIELLGRALCAPQPLAHIAPLQPRNCEGGQMGAYGSTRGVIHTLLKHRGWSIVKQLPVERCRKGHGRGFR